MLKASRRKQEESHGEAPSRDNGETFIQDFVRSYGDALYRTACYLTRNPQDAQDLVQETFLRAWRYRHAFHSGSNARAWLFKILYNLHIDRKRKEHREPAIELNDTTRLEEFYLYRQIVPSDMFLPARDPESLILEALLDTEIQQALEKLPEHYRTPFLLSALEGLSYQEVSEVLEIPVGTVMSRLYRARSILQRQLWDYFVERYPQYRLTAEIPALPADCADSCRAMSAYLDRELDPKTMEIVQSHLDVCRRCCDQLEFERRLSAFIRERLRRQRLPRAFKHRLKQLVSLL